jgi:hypothetical protein
MREAPQVMQRPRFVPETRVAAADPRRKVEVEVLERAWPAPGIPSAVRSSRESDVHPVSAYGPRDVALPGSTVHRTPETVRRTDRPAALRRIDPQPRAPSGSRGDTARRALNGLTLVIVVPTVVGAVVFVIAVGVFALLAWLAFAASS